MAAAAILRNQKSPYVGLDWSDLVEIWHSEVVRSSWRVRPLKIKNIKIQDNGGRHFENSTNCDISAAVRAISTKFGIMMQFDTLDRSDR